MEHANWFQEQTQKILFEMMCQPKSRHYKADLAKALKDAKGAADEGDGEEVGSRKRPRKSGSGGTGTKKQRKSRGGRGGKGRGRGRGGRGGRKKKGAGEKGDDGDQDSDGEEDASQEAGWGDCKCRLSTGCIFESTVCKCH